MKLRIHRTWSWVLDCSRSEMIYGGKNPMKLVSHDELQFLDIDNGNRWTPIRVMEEDKPEEPKGW